MVVERYVWSVCRFVVVLAMAVVADLKNAFDAVLFEAEIISVLRDSESRILEGSPSDTETIKNVWTFARDTSNQDPNWLLIATEIQD